MFRKLHPQVGARPGTVLIPEDAQPSVLTHTSISEDAATCVRCQSEAEIPLADKQGPTTWIDLNGLGDGGFLQKLAALYRIAPLAVEDLANAPQRPKVEVFPHQKLIIAHCMVHTSDGQLTVRQIGIVQGQNYVLTIHEGCEEVLAPIRARLRNPQARLRRNGPDYLMYAILDVCVDGYYPVLEKLGEKIESLEKQALDNPRPELLARIHSTKNQLAQLRRSIWPQREMVQSLLTEESQFIADDTRTYLRDTLDHCTQLADVVDMYRESTSGLVNTYMSIVAHRSNEIMKVLTLLTSVFVPPTFVAGVYGMNFTGMYELEMPGAYPAALLLMAALIAGALYYFYRRGWLIRTPIASQNKQPQIPTNVPAETCHLVIEDIQAPRQRAA